jgi:hypothetical protein
MCFLRKALLVALVVQSSAAVAGCVEPAAPTCVNHSALIADQQEFDQCRQAVEQFRSETREHLLCLKSEVSRALDHFNGAVDRFNERVHVSNKTLRSSKAAKELMY